MTLPPSNQDKTDPEPRRDDPDDALLRQLRQARPDNPQETATMPHTLENEVIAAVDSRGDIWYGSDILVLKGQEGQSFKIPVANLPVKLGRGQEADVIIPSSSVSKIHAQLIRTGMLVLIEDLDSKNGLFINLLPVKFAALRIGDKIQLGGYTLVVQGG